MTGGFGFQEKFVAQLKSVVAVNINLADELSDLLNVSTDSVYRRLRCQSSFSGDEIAIISKKFGISLDGLLESDSLQVTFNFNPLFEHQANFFKFLAWLAKDLNELAHLPGTLMTYAADDVPVFRHFNFPNLSAFKGFYWSKAVLNYEVYNGRKFNPALIPKEAIEMNKKAYDAYAQIDSVEIWSEESITSTLKQVEFFWESDLFETKEQALLVIQEIREMMEVLKLECLNSRKNHPTNPGSFMLYNAEVMIGNNCVMINPGGSHVGEKVFLGNNTFNNISTYNAAFIKETRFWMDNLIKKSLLLSGTAEKQRARFFKKMDEKINNLERNVMGTTSVGF